MKTICTLIVYVLLSNGLFGQTGYDYVNNKDIFLLKSSMNESSGPKIKAASLGNLESVELLFGRNYEAKDYINLLDNEVYTTVIFPDGLELELSKSQKQQAFYKITSEKYKLVLSDGKEIKVGMNGTQLEEIFPKSYSKRAAYTDSGPKKGKASFIVYFGRIKDGEIYYYDERIIFILSSKDGVLEQFFTFRSL